MNKPTLKAEGEQLLIDVLLPIVRTYHHSKTLLIDGVFVPIEESGWQEGMRKQPATAVELRDAIVFQLQILGMANEHLRNCMRTAFAVRDDACAASQRYLDELRELRGAKNA